MTAVADRVTRVDICSLTELTPELGVAALVGGEQVAVFRLADDRVFAVSNHCPFSGAAVMPAASPARAVTCRPSRRRSTSRCSRSRTAAAWMRSTRCRSPGVDPTWRCTPSALTMVG